MFNTPTIVDADDQSQAALVGYLRSMACSQERCAVALEGILKFLTKATDLNLVVEGGGQETKGSEPVGNKKATGSPVKVSMKKKGAVGAVMPDVTLTSAPASITLVPVDSANNPVAISPSDSVVGTLSSDSSSFAIGAGADTLHYVATIPANTPQGTVVNMSATLIGTIQNAPADFTSSVKVTLDIPPSPVAVDLDIIIS